MKSRSIFWKLLIFAFGMGYGSSMLIVNTQDLLTRTDSVYTFIMNTLGMTTGWLWIYIALMVLDIVSIKR